ncbi:MAG: hypothetical protein A2Y64_00555 [Candidatus Coatesbacteria bacterium RBG_13_66_14]|uniref:Uncharacterized protein n=1 Tax=Candidatus Coatesbacteria bacterium RBG_13_66_14 TaxID=1817816 RepID=A0A1F5EYA5_9BACT|nr:MAG: hypothetical protein A2Y64_00555 [Candidatus Coatesbacteria bacterium RBG_13_66_14]
MRYRLLGLESASLIRFLFFGFWIVLGGLGLIAYAAYIIGSIEEGLVEDEFLAVLFGCVLGPPFYSLVFAGIGVLGNFVYRKLARSLPPLVAEMEEAGATDAHPVRGGAVADDRNRLP